MIDARIELHENEIAKIIVDAALHVHKTLGPGLLESVYEVVLAYELRKRGLLRVRQSPVPIIYDSIRFEEGFRIDILVQNKVIVELKSIEATATVHSKQVLTYLRLTDLRLGLLINFGQEYLKDGITRLVNKLPEQEA
jgi:GxxExxY protein